MDVSALINDFNNSLKTLYSDFTGTYLFGSRANNTQNSDSDVDIILMFSKVNNDKKNDVYNIISDLMYKYNVFIDAKIMDEDLLKYNPFFYEEVKKNGCFYGV